MGKRVTLLLDQVNQMEKRTLTEIAVLLVTRISAGVTGNSAARKYCLGGNIS